MSKDYKRSDKVNNRLQRELAKLVQLEFKDPRVGMVTITAVNVSNDLSVAKVYVSTLGDEAQIQEAITILNNGAGYLRTMLAKRLEMRSTPELRFLQDHTITRGTELSNLIDKAVKDDEKHNKS
ncbi:MAG: ribosome-binding factor A [Legionellales bacterium]|nr:ribosome-binding factor A [Legionellales bacterium]|tara:strand:+ start:4662 stop:5033 length:372 start_codon:yes stop_codon:yes gene_type:complete